MPFGIQIRIRGARRVQRALAKVPKKLQRRTLRNALAAGGGVIKRATQARAPKETGLMRRSLRVKPVKVSFAKGVLAYRVGPKSDKRAIARTKTGKLRAAGKKRVSEEQAAGRRVRYRDPARYAALVELGHKLRRKGRTYGRVRGSHFMRGAFRSNRRQAMTAVIRKIKQAISRAGR